MNILHKATHIWKSIRSSLASPSEWLLKILGAGEQSKAGVEVSADNALQLSTVFACVNLITNAMASLGIALYKRTDKGKLKAVNHPIYELIHYMPNPETTAFDFWVMYIVNLLLTGDGFAYIQRDGNARVKALWNLPSGNVRIRHNEETNELYYLVKDKDGAWVKYYPENILHTRGMRFNSTEKSVNPVKMAREAIGLAIALEEFGEKFFSNGANTGGIVKVKAKLSDSAFERFKKSFNEKYSGIGNSSKVVFLEEGTEFVKTGTDPDKAQSLESRKFQIAEIARYFYNVPLHKILELDRATFNNIEQLNIAFVQDCLNPISVRIEQSIYKCLLSPNERKQYFAKWNTNALLRGDINARKDFYSSMIQNGVFSPNDVLEFEDMNTYDGGDVHIFNGSSIPVEKINQNMKEAGD